MSKNDKPSTISDTVAGFIALGVVVAIFIVIVGVVGQGYDGPRTAEEVTSPEQVVRACNDGRNGEPMALLDWIKKDRVRVDGDGTFFDDKELYDEDEDGIPEVLIRLTYSHLTIYGEVLGESMGYIEWSDDRFSCELIMPVHTK